MKYSDLMSNVIHHVSINEIVTVSFDDLNFVLANLDVYVICAKKLSYRYPSKGNLSEFDIVLL